MPRFYRQEPDGRIVPDRPGVPAIVNRAMLPRLSDSPSLRRPIVPLAEAVHERVMIEIMRGCPNGCRFCQAGFTRLPVRIRKPEEIVDIAREALAATGYKEISLLSLSSSDYPNLEGLIDRLNAEFASQHVSISLPSLRVSSQLRILPKLTSGVRKGGLTIAAEAGSQRLRDLLNKGITEEDMLAGVRAAYEAGWRSVKVYFMAGLPTETDEDLDAIYRLCRKLSDARRDVDGQRGSITASVSWFVPKPHTPMQWAAMRGADYFWHVRNMLRDLAKRSPVVFRFHRIERSLLEGALCRGGGELADVIEAAWRGGCRMDSWDDQFSFPLWQAAFEQCGVDLDSIIGRQPDPDAPTPWSHIRCFRGEDWLRATAISEFGFQISD